jgi:hypothetical protein
LRLFPLALLSLLTLLPASSVCAQQAPAWEFFTGYSFERSAVRTYYRSTPIIYTFREQYINLDGWELSVTENVNRWFGGTFQATGHFKSPVVLGTKTRQRLFSFMYGPRFSYRAGWSTAFGHVLFGASRASATVSPGPHASETAFTAAAGLGLDVNLGSKAAMRVLQIQYSPMNPLATKDHKFQASAGFVFYLGNNK